jgi:hypothetical protein
MYEVKHIIGERTNEGKSQGAEKILSEGRPSRGIQESVGREKNTQDEGQGNDTNVKCLQLY